MPKGQETAKAVYVRIKLARNNPYCQELIAAYQSNKALYVSPTEYVSGAALIERIFHLGLAAWVETTWLSKGKENSRTSPATSENAAAETLEASCDGLDTKPL
jgi:hypothetical protein